MGPDVVALNPAVVHGVDPLGVHALDVGARLGHVFILWRVELAADQVGGFARQVLIVLCAHLLAFLFDIALRIDEGVSGAVLADGQAVCTR